MVKKQKSSVKVEHRFQKWLQRTFGRTTGNIVFNVVVYAFLIVFAFVMFYPFAHVLIKSLESRVPTGDGTFKFAYNFAAYKAVLGDASGFVWSFIWSIFVCLVVAAAHVFCCMLTAYPLSKRELKGKKFIMFYMIFTMLFGGGLIPYYLLIRDLGLFNNPLIYLLPALVSAYDVIIAQRFMMGIPDSLAESAQIDGAGHYQIFFKIYLPLSKPIMATLGLWMFVGKWNDWMTGLMYMPKKPELQLIQTYLRRVLNVAKTQTDTGGAVDEVIMSMSGSVQMATIVVGMLPIVLMYPFVQKYFVKGTLVGSVKG